MHFGEGADGAQERRGDAVDADGVAEGFDVAEDSRGQQHYAEGSPSERGRQPDI